MTDSNTTDRSKALLYRRATGKRILAGYLRKLATVFPDARQDDLLSLDATDAILARFNEKKSGLREERRRIEPSEVRPFLSKAIKAYQDGFYAFIDDDWKYCGAISFNAPALVASSFEFGDEVLNDLIVIGHGMEMAASLDFFEMNGRWLIDIIEWHK